MTADSDADLVNSLHHRLGRVEGFAWAVEILAAETAAAFAETAPRPGATLAERFALLLGRSYQTSRAVEAAMQKLRTAVEVERAEFAAIVGGGASGARH